MSVEDTDAGSEQGREQQLVVGLQLLEYAGEFECRVDGIRRHGAVQELNGLLGAWRLAADVQFGVFHGVGYDSAAFPGPRG